MSTLQKFFGEVLGGRCWVAVIVAAILSVILVTTAMVRGMETLACVSVSSAAFVAVAFIVKDAVRDTWGPPRS